MGTVKNDTDEESAYRDAGELVVHLTSQVTEELNAQAEAMDGQIAVTTPPNVYLHEKEGVSPMLIVVSGSIAVHYLPSQHATEIVPRRRQQSQQLPQAASEAEITAIIDKAIDAVDQGGGRVTVKQSAKAPPRARNTQVFTVDAKTKGRVAASVRTIDANFSETDKGREIVKAQGETEAVLPSAGPVRREPTLRGVFED